MDNTTHRAHDTSGTLDEALERLHSFGPEREGRLSNHAPMAVEALVRHGQAPGVHRWLDHYRTRLEDMPDRFTEVTPANWREALGDPRRIADWTAYFERETADRPWREVLAEWWPRLLPGIAAGATHPVIRVGHCVRTLLASGENAPRVAELAHGLGYWAARHQPLPPLTALAPAPTADAAAALDAVDRLPDQNGGIRERLGQLTGFPRWPGRPVTDPDLARTRLQELVHAATAPDAVLRTLPALPRELWAPSLGAAWAAGAAVTAAYFPAQPAGYPAAPDGLTPEEVFAQAAAHGDDHTIKFTDTALDVGGPAALAAALRSVELNPPVL
ncbi:questin oxidase family protein [Streptomyces brevispora]|uniref:questin oxidase family protein n=1 Tax=Streptomyces brevispora TaxID=887462 RepID=UPI002E326832|nr:questin oxidase family protein [Streptomyces brevispora]